MATCGFTSGRAEWLCKQQPPGGLSGTGGKPTLTWNLASLIQNPFKHERLPPADVRQKRKQKAEALPQTNIEDLPEASTNSWRGAQRLCMGAATWKDIRTVPEEAVLDLEKLFLLEDVANYTLLEEVANHSLLEDATGQDVDVAQYPDAWPSLAEANHGFEECELSSVASSWMDVGDLGEVLEEGDILVVSQEPKPSATGAHVTWASRMQQNRGQGVTHRPTVCDDFAKFAGCIKPPMAAPMQRQQRRTARDEDEPDPILQELEDRRLLSRGYKAKPRKKR